MARYSLLFDQKSCRAKLLFIFAPIFSVISEIESKSIICEISINTFVYVNDCPRSLEEWTKASDIKQCYNVPQNCTSSEQFRYHCLLDPSNQRLFEICATERIMTGQFCPKFNIHGFRLENNYARPCVNSTPSCPYHYSSTDVYKYKNCYQQESTSNENSHGITTVSILRGNTSKKSKGMHDEPKPPFPVYAIIIIPCVCVATLIIILIFVIKCLVKKRRKGSPRNIHEQEALNP
ncbi:uncharacterized protein LOC133178489 [Saccostrea echinata]|uniref:uncharacterized protein LOC133178489 n=1 Tax=Saccostrea echinata TaxID=191078 RepID=UPI002A80DD49|nr:uncharacterized protein LOC133178489 [Saccostrea echinata]